MLKKTLNKSLKRSYESKFLYINDQKQTDSMSGIRATIFGGTSKLGLTIGSTFGEIGSDIIFPCRTRKLKTLESEKLKFLRLSGFLGQIYINKDTNFNDPNALNRLIKPSNIVINLIAGLNTYKNISDFEEANINIPRKLARISKNSGIKKFIHFSKIGVCPKSESLDLRTSYWGEKAVLEEFPNATILRLGPTVGFADDIQLIFRKQQEYFNGMAPVYSDLKALKQPVLETDIAKVCLNAVKMDFADGKTFEVCGPFVYSQRQIFEIMQNVLQRPIRFVKVNEVVARKVGAWVGWNFFNRERVVKEGIDMVGGRVQGVFGCEELGVRCASVVPSLKYHLGRFAKPLDISKNDYVI